MKKLIQVNNEYYLYNGKKMKHLSRDKLLLYLIDEFNQINEKIDRLTSIVSQNTQTVKRWLDNGK